MLPWSAFFTWSSKGLDSPLAGGAAGAGVGQRGGVIGDDGLEIGTLPPLLAAVAIGGGGGDASHLLSFVEHCLLYINPIHHPAAGRARDEAWAGGTLGGGEEVPVGPWADAAGRAVRRQREAERGEGGGVRSKHRKQRPDEEPEGGGGQRIGRGGRRGRERGGGEESRGGWRTGREGDEVRLRR